ncbi:hypothetical protein [Streptomyces sp. NPDC048659]|uniref:hypothetical protein n=1 Tax=Streptomyces sp. NPDC048659 TaxID=3155489 RepID=UPI00341E0096
MAAAEGRRFLRCRRCRRTWGLYDTSPSPAPTYYTAYRLAPPEREEDEALAALEAGLDAAKKAGRRPDPIARRLLLLRRAALADRRAYTAELEYLGGGSSLTEAERELDRADVAAKALCDFDVVTASVYAGGGIRPEHSIWDDEPGTVRAYARQEYTEWTGVERALISGS